MSNEVLSVLFILIGILSFVEAFTLIMQVVLLNMIKSICKEDRDEN